MANSRKTERVKYGEDGVYVVGALSRGDVHYIREVASTATLEDTKEFEVRLLERGVIQPTLKRVGWEAWWEETDFREVTEVLQAILKLAGLLESQQKELGLPS